ncbi:hypothetical protein LR48_Vigan05g080500 [Vigna angularis]|uniref:Uncharacterized protein n=1 Tax=Phaseolus angularis TaxID=3914 RepID=A0A0L9UKI5_PHAAN|nr:hypothetical protein LR48_Vigan05g080500 [Vigna angularis]
METTRHEGWEDGNDDPCESQAPQNRHRRAPKNVNRKIGELLMLGFSELGIWRTRRLEIAKDRRNDPDVISFPSNRTSSSFEFCLQEVEWSEDRSDSWVDPGFRVRTFVHYRSRILSFGKNTVLGRTPSYISLTFERSAKPMGLDPERSLWLALGLIPNARPYPYLPNVGK